MWAKRGELGYHSLGQTFGGYHFRGLIPKLRHPLAQIPASDIHGLYLPCCGVASFPPGDPSVIFCCGVYDEGYPAPLSGSRDCRGSGYEACGVKSSSE